MPNSRADHSPDFATARRMMVDGQLRTYDITDQTLLAAFLDVPRERFVSAAQTGIAYLDIDLPMGKSGARRMLKPMVFAKMVQAAAIAPSDHVLDVGCASGYSAAVLAKLAGSVVALEADADLADEARKALGAAVTVVNGPLAEGCAAKGPFDAILVEGAVEMLPPGLLRQLKEGGRLVAVVGDGPAAKATLYRLVQGEISARPIFDASAARLPGFSKPAEFVF
jgi:protein-L-isoaspartate(D-aspartate) O-methyltransferase